MATKFAVLLGLAVAAVPAGAAQARDFEMGGDSQYSYSQYPYSIMAPEPGSGPHRRHPSSPKRPAKTSHREAPPVTPPVTPLRYGSYRHGSSGSVLPTPLPKTQLIPPEGGGVVATPAIPQQQGPSYVPGLARPLPNLPHGPETFQDRAARCSFQAGLNNVPGTLTNQYIGGCVQ